eukprot:scaffold340_cov256-Pinguiococcus_pyrenoidosus.AAC.27
MSALSLWWMARRSRVHPQHRTLGDPARHARLLFLLLPGNSPQPHHARSEASRAALPADRRTPTLSIIPPAATHDTSH